MLCKLPQLVSLDDLGGRRCFVFLTDGEGPFEVLLARDGRQAAGAFALLEIGERHIERHWRRQSGRLHVPKVCRCHRLFVEDVFMVRVSIEFILLVSAALVQDNKAMLAHLILSIPLLVIYERPLSFFVFRRHPRIEIVLHQQIVVKGAINIVLLNRDARTLLVWLFS